MNVIWIVADTFRRDHLGCYGHPYIRTPALDALAARSIRYCRHYTAGYPTVPARADHHTGQWMMSRLDEGPFPHDVTTLARLLANAGIHTAAVADTPFYWRHGMNFDRGFQSFFAVQGQGGSRGRYIPDARNHEWKDIVAGWSSESDRNVARTMTLAGDWLERHRKDPFFLYVDTWDPHEPWDAPSYYTEMYMPDYDGELVMPLSGLLQHTPSMTEAKLDKAHATYCGEITLVDTWIGHLLRKVENAGLAANTAIIFTSDHGIYFGEHGGIFGKYNRGIRDDGAPHRDGELPAVLGHSPLDERIVGIPLLISVPGVSAGVYHGLTSAIDIMPTVLELAGQTIPDRVDGRSLLPSVYDQNAGGREFTVSGFPLTLTDEIDPAKPKTGPVTTVTAGHWSLLYSIEPGMSELYDLSTDPAQENNIIGRPGHIARELHAMLVRFMRENGLPEFLVRPRLELRL